MTKFVIAVGMILFAVPMMGQETKAVPPSQTINNEDGTVTQVSFSYEDGKLIRTETTVTKQGQITITTVKIFVVNNDESLSLIETKITRTNEKGEVIEEANTNPVSGGTSTGGSASGGQNSDDTNYVSPNNDDIIIDASPDGTP